MKLWNKAINGFPPETRNGACSVPPFAHTTTVLLRSTTYLQPTIAATTQCVFSLLHISSEVNENERIFRESSLGKREQSSCVDVVLVV
jgi:hypothetical protein